MFTNKNLILILKALGVFVCLMAGVLITSLTERLLNNYTPIITALSKVAVGIPVTLFIFHFYAKRIGVKLPVLDTPNKFVISWLLLGFFAPLIIIAFYYAMGCGYFQKHNNLDFWSGFIKAISTSVFSCIISLIGLIGYMYAILRTRLSKSVAIILPGLFSTLGGYTIGIHSIQSFIFAFIGSTIFLLVFINICEKTNNIWNAIAMNFGWTITSELIFVFHDRAELIDHPWDSIIYEFIIPSKNILLTGGGFGIVSSLPSIILYVVILLIVDNRYSRVGNTDNIRFW